MSDTPPTPDAGSKSIQGTFGHHPVRPAQTLRVAPTDQTAVNTLSIDLVAVACIQLPDLLFEFDSSFPTPGIAQMLPQIAPLRQAHKNAAGTLPPLSIFGHADPVGNDDYNKVLSGRRAMAIHAALVHDPASWNFLFDNPHGGDDWKQRKVSATMAAATGKPASTPRATLIDAYMTLLFPEPLQKNDFLGQGSDAKGKADFQGCGEFNPLVLLSDKENQTLAKADRDASNQSNRRVIIFMFRPGVKLNPALWPCPTALADAGPCHKRFFGPPRTGDLRRGSGDERREYAKTQDTFACRFYDRIARLSPCELPAPSAVPVRVEVVLDANGDHAVDANEAVAPFVRVGLWDRAFIPATGVLRNDVAEVDNFVGADLRRFYFRVVDSLASGEVRVRWRTTGDDGTDQNAPPDQEVTCTETATGSGVFVSHAMMLVTDQVDNDQGINSGLAASQTDAGNRGPGISNHRTRLFRIDNDHRLASQIVVEYTPAGRLDAKPASVPIFNRSPDERLKLKVHIVNVRDAVGGTPILTASRKAQGLAIMRAIYATCGIFIEADEIVIDPPASCIGWPLRYPGAATVFDPAVEAASMIHNNMTPSASMFDLINAVRARPGFDVNDIYIVYVDALYRSPLPTPSPAPGPPGASPTVGPGAVSFPDSFIVAGSLAQSFTFVGVNHVNPLADCHEITHTTTNLRNSSGGHFHLGATLDIGPGPVDGRNLMQRFVLISNGTPTDSRRLWDESFTNTGDMTPAVIPAQVTAIRSSRFVKPL